MSINNLKIIVSSKLHRLFNGEMKSLPQFCFYIILVFSVANTSLLAEEESLSSNNLSSMSVDQILVNLKIGKLSLSDKIKHYDELRSKIIVVTSNEGDPIKNLQTALVIPLDSYDQNLASHLVTLIDAVLSQRYNGTLNLSSNWIKSNQFFSSISLKELVFKLISKYPSTKDSLINLLEARITDLLNSDIEDLPYESFSALSYLDVNGFSNIDKDFIISSTADVYSKKGKNFLFSRINELKKEGRIGLMDKVRLFKNGWYLSSYYLKYYIFLSLFIALVVFILRKKSKAFINLYFHKFLVAMGIDKEEIYSYLMKDNEDDELAKLYRIIGIDEDCTDEELAQRFESLKAKYEKIKTPESTSEFKEIRLSYSRIKQIRRSSFNFATKEE